MNKNSMVITIVESDQIPHALVVVSSVVEHPRLCHRIKSNMLVDNIRREHLQEHTRIIFKLKLQTVYVYLSERLFHALCMCTTQYVIPQVVVDRAGCKRFFARDKIQVTILPERELQKTTHRVKQLGVQTNA